MTEATSANLRTKIATTQRLGLLNRLQSVASNQPCSPAHAPAVLTGTGFVSQEVCGLWQKVEEEMKLKKVRIMELNQKLSKSENQRSDKVR